MSLCRPTNFQDRILLFATNLSIQWRRCRLGTVDPVNERDFIAVDSLKTTIPALWQTLRMCLFSTTIVLQALVSGLLESRVAMRRKGKYCYLHCTLSLNLTQYRWAKDGCEDNRDTPVFLLYHQQDGCQCLLGLQFHILCLHRYSGS